MNERGIIYVATGEKYLAEAVASAQSVRAVMPEIPMSIWTDQAPPDGLFESVHPADGKEHGRIAKMRAMASSPYGETLFLDSDTHMCQPCHDIFWPLQKYDLAVAHEVYRNEYSFESYPDSFPALNTGVVVYRNSDEMRAFFQTWEDSYMAVFRHKQKFDQPAFRHTLFHSELRHYVLPQEFNFRTNYPVVLGGFATAKIIHDRSPYVRELAELLGRSTSHPPLYFGPLHPKFVRAWTWLRFRTLYTRAKTIGLRGLWLRTLGKKARNP